MNSSQIFSLGISVLALIISGYSIWKSIKSHRRSFSNEYFHKVFDKYILKDFPQATNSIKNSSVHDSLDKCIPLFELIEVFMQDILFYKYFDNKFYKEILDQVKRIEDSMAILINKDEESEYADLLDSFEEEVVRFYKKLNNNYLKL